MHVFCIKGRHDVLDLLPAEIHLDSFHDARRFIVICKGEGALDTLEQGGDPMVDALVNETD